MGELRTPPSTRKKLEEIAKETNPRKALASVVDLFNNYVAEEERVVSHYDQRTGKPVKHKWKKCRDYSSQEEIPLDSYSHLGTPSLDGSVVKFVRQKGPVLVNTDFGKYVFSYDTRSMAVDSGRMGESAMGEGRFILITKVVNES